MNASHAFPESYRDPSLGGTEILISDQPFALHKLVAHGKKGVVWKARNRYGRDRAVKLVAPSEYSIRQPLEEMELATQLESYSRYFARLEQTDYVTLPVGEGLLAVAFVSEWLNGQTLDQILRNPDGIATSVILSYCRNMSAPVEK